MPHATDLGPVLALRHTWAHRFWSNVEKTQRCWIWRGTHTRKGYGLLAIGGTQYQAHRLAFGLRKQTPSIDLMILHNCDNPTCVRPAHLHEGDAKMNAHEAHRRGLVGKRLASGMMKLRTARVPGGWGEPDRLNYQLTIPLRHVRALGWERGDELEAVRTKDGIALRRRKA